MLSEPSSPIFIGEYFESQDAITKGGKGAWAQTGSDTGLAYGSG